MSDHGSAPQVIYWHRHLPPPSAEVMGDHTIEATSARVQGRLAHGDAMWGSCYESLMSATEERLRQELARLGGDYAHVLTESIDSKHDAHTDEGWLHGRFDYVLYREPSKTPAT